MEVRPFLCCFGIFFDFFAPRTDGVPHFWRHGPMGYPFLAPFWCQVCAILGHLGWAGGAARSVNNLTKAIRRNKFSCILVKLNKAILEQFDKFR